MSKNSLCEEVIIAGFGGQGIIMSGKLLSQAAMEAGKEVTYMPSYGAEVRGGTANCAVTIADRQIASPLVSGPDSLIVMNKASLSKFAPRVKVGGLLIYNSSLVDIEDVELAQGVVVREVPADEIAVELGNKKCANMVALGAYLEARGILNMEAAVRALPKVLAKRYHNMLDVNNKALRRGAEFIRQESVVG